MWFIASYICSLVMHCFESCTAEYLKNGLIFLYHTGFSRQEITEIIGKSNRVGYSQYERKKHCIITLSGLDTSKFSLTIVIGNC